MASPSTFLVILASLIFLVSSQCNLPPALWCDNHQTARDCGVERQCRSWRETPTASKYNVSLLYETHCPASQDYFVNYFYPFVYQRLQSHNIINLNLVPWGNAVRLPNGRVHCQHGQKECDGARLTSCVQYYVPDMHRQMDFSYCLLKNLMQRVELYRAKRVCFDQMKMDTNVRQKIKTCYKGQLGDQLQQEAESITTSFTPKVDAVPHLIVNGYSLSSVQIVTRDMHNLLPFWSHQANPQRHLMGNSAIASANTQTAQQTAIPAPAKCSADEEVQQVQQAPQQHQQRHQAQRQYQEEQRRQHAQQREQHVQRQHHRIQYPRQHYQVDRLPVPTQVTENRRVIGSTQVRIGGSQHRYATQSKTNSEHEVHRQQEGQRRRDEEERRRDEEERRRQYAQREEEQRRQHEEEQRQRQEDQRRRDHHEKQEEMQRLEQEVERRAEEDRRRVEHARRQQQEVVVAHRITERPNEVDPDLEEQRRDNAEAALEFALDNDEERFTEHVVDEDRRHQVKEQRLREQQRAQADEIERRRQQFMQHNQHDVFDMRQEYQQPLLATAGSHTRRPREN